MREQITAPLERVEEGHAPPMDLLRLGCDERADYRQTLRGKFVPPRVGPPPSQGELVHRLKVARAQMPDHRHGRGVRLPRGPLQAAREPLRCGVLGSVAYRYHLAQRQ